MSDSVPASVSIVIPAYNEERNIGGVLEELKAYTASRPEITWEIIVVNDCSGDGTARAASAIAGVTVLSHPQNRGYGAALKTGIRAASGEFILMFDADGQHIAGEIDKLLPGSLPFDMTVGARDLSSTPRARRPGKRLLTLAACAMIGQQVPDVNSGLRLIRRSTLLTYLPLCSNRFSFSLSSTMALMTEGHFVRFIGVETRSRTDHESQVRLSTGLRALLMVFRITLVFHPMRIFLPFSLVFGAMWTISMIHDVFDNNVSKLSLMLLFFTGNGLLTGFVADQISHVRRELKQAVKE